MNILFDWCAQEGVKSIFNLVKNILYTVRIVVPIGLVLLTTIDIFKLISNPNGDDSGKKIDTSKIMRRIITAVIIFFIPVFVRLILKLVEIGGGSVSISRCFGG